MEYCNFGNIGNCDFENIENCNFENIFSVKTDMFSIVNRFYSAFNYTSHPVYFFLLPSIKRQLNLKRSIMLTLCKLVMSLGFSIRPLHFLFASTLFHGI